MLSGNACMPWHSSISICPRRYWFSSQGSAYTHTKRAYRGWGLGRHLFKNRQLCHSSSAFENTLCLGDLILGWSIQTSHIFNQWPMRKNCFSMLTLWILRTRSASSENVALLESYSRLPAYEMAFWSHIFLTQLELILYYLSQSSRPVPGGVVTFPLSLCHSPLVSVGLFLT